MSSQLCFIQLLLWLDVSKKCRVATSPWQAKSRSISFSNWKSIFISFLHLNRSIVHVWLLFLIFFCSHRFRLYMRLNIANGSGEDFPRDSFDFRKIDMCFQVSFYFQYYTEYGLSFCYFFWILETILCCYKLIQLFFSFELHADS